MDISSALPRQNGQTRIRQLESKDAAAFADGTRDEAVTRYAHLPLTEYTPQVVQAQIDGVIAAGLADGSLAVLAVADSGTDDFLGSVVVFGIGDCRAEVGFWLAPWARGRGAAGAALEAVVGLAADLGLETLTARTAPENVASQRVLEKAGFTREGEPRIEAAPSGQMVTLLCYERPTGVPTSGDGR